MRTFAAALVGATLVACGSASASPASGLRGTFTIGPLTPVCSPVTPCDGPARHATLAFTRNGTTRRTTTDDFGRYRIRLAPGWYAVRTSVGIGQSPQPARVRVVAGRFRLVNFVADTGIR
jgi:hypothetical protein